MSKRKNKQGTPPSSHEAAVPSPQPSTPPRGRFILVWLSSLLFLAQSVLCVYLFVRDSTPKVSPVQRSELERILALPDPELEKVSIARINLLVAKEILPGLDVAKYEADFDHLVQGLKAANQRHGADSRDPDKLIRVLNTYLYMDKKFRYAKLGNSTDPALLALDPAHLFLHGILA